eukprot:GDKI01017199.1.p1 GENE.GDKI01017199.1~~GDKI01017199.1.p1  ORF type:complete len:271 (-),score=86.03 GDKI01017199.1:23-835(-)
MSVEQAMSLFHSATEQVKVHVLPLVGIQSTDPLADNAALVVVFVLTVVAMWLVLQLLSGTSSSSSSRKRLGNSVLLLGPCDAGKTALFFLWRNGSLIETVSSLKANTDTIDLLNRGDKSTPIEVIDYPGHGRLKDGAMQSLEKARCIVYLVDAANRQSLKTAAESLYDIFTHPTMGVKGSKPPLLIACNKQDVGGARKKEGVVEDLEREIERLRQSRGVALEGQDEADSFLGIEGEPFKLEHAPCSVRVCECAVAEEKIDELNDFVAENF